MIWWVCEARAFHACLLAFSLGRVWMLWLYGRLAEIAADAGSCDSLSDPLQDLF